MTGRHQVAQRTPNFFLNFLGALNKKRANSDDATILDKGNSQNINPGKVVNSKYLPLEILSDRGEALTKAEKKPSSECMRPGSGSKSLVVNKLMACAS